MISSTNALLPSLGFRRRSRSRDDRERRERDRRDRERRERERREADRREMERRERDVADQPVIADLAPGPAARNIEHAERGAGRQVGQHLGIVAAGAAQQRARAVHRVRQRHDVMLDEDFAGEADMRKITAHRQVRRVELHARTGQREANPRRRNVGIFAQTLTNPSRMRSGALIP